MIFPLLIIGAGIYLFSKKENKTTALSGVKNAIKLSFPKGTTKEQKELILSWAKGGSKLSGAFYKRNNSYSRSYNASEAEREGRFPLTKAAEYLGVSVAAMKKGMKHADYTTSEWHHVGKYANRIDYYDANYLYNDYKFWFGAMTKSNKKHCMDNLVRIARQKLAEKLNPKTEKQHKEARYDAIKRRMKQLNIHSSVVIPYTAKLDNKTLFQIKKEAQQAKHIAAKERMKSNEKSVKTRSRSAARNKVKDKKEAELKRAIAKDIEANFKTYFSAIKEALEKGKTTNINNARASNDIVNKFNELRKYYPNTTINSFGKYIVEDGWANLKELSK